MHRALRAALLQERARLCAGTLARAGSGRRNHRARDVRVVAHRPRTVLCRHAQLRSVREVRRGISAEGKARAARAVRVKRTCVILSYTKLRTLVL